METSKFNKVIDALRERTKELNCLYQVEDLLNHSDDSIEEVLTKVIATVPAGLQFPDITLVRITLNGKSYLSPDFKETPWMLSGYIELQSQIVGHVSVYYTREMPVEDFGPFLKEEKKLIGTIADRISHFILHKHLKEMVHRMDSARESSNLSTKDEWPVVVELLKNTDQDLFLRISRKMMNFLCWNGIQEARSILQQLSPDSVADRNAATAGGNRPIHMDHVDPLSLSERIFEVASKNMRDEEILKHVQKWMQEDKSNFLLRTAIDLDSSLGDIADAIRRYYQLSKRGVELSESTYKGVIVALVRRFLSEQLEFIRIAKDYVDISDFIELIPRLIYPPGSHGQLGGKGAGLFLASRILQQASINKPELKDIRVPKTWYITSDGLHVFMNYNTLGDVTEQKYKEIGQVRQEYPHIIQVFKNSHFSPDIKQGLSMALDDFGERPLIVRSSSLLEDRLGAAFSGKYVSLFLANQGPKEDRLEALMDAISEVYSSVFGSDPIEYRAERGLLDFHEEMGILIQEVVGTQVDKYFLPTFAGVAFSNNEFRWSSRIKREDGLLRIVPALGTRAVDRTDDYPILVAPGQPNLRVNVTVDEMIRYAPNKMDVINLETNDFETVDIQEFLREHGSKLPGVENLVSIHKDDVVTCTSLFNLDFENDDIVVTLEGLISKTNFVSLMKQIVESLQEALGEPVDIEFASNGKEFYLLQCRPQSYAAEDVPMPIPKDIPDNAIVFTANRYVSNGRVPDITHIVYVDPQKYSELQTREEMVQVGRAVGLLNTILPKRQFILMGPGRWGSRGDIKLGVNVTYSDINNTSMLVEIARQKGNYIPDLSFGTHFFQDLVEAQIRYLPLYPDDEEILFNEQFLLDSENILPRILPEYEYFKDTVRVIDVPESTDGKVLRIFMNAELDEALGVLTQPTGEILDQPKMRRSPEKQIVEEHWRWRSKMVERIAEDLDPKRFGVKALYVFGSTKNGTAGPGSDIDLLVHFDGTEEQKRDLTIWLEGWSRCLDEMNYLRTGYKAETLLDVHLVTDSDIQNRSDYAVKIGAVTDAAKPIPLRNS